MSGLELENHRINIECEVVNGADPDIPGALTVTINPFVPSLYAADSFGLEGAFPTMTLTQILGTDEFMRFNSERHEAIEVGRAFWPQIRMLFQYYLQDNPQMFARIAQQHFGLDWEPHEAHQRTSIAYQSLGSATTMIAGSTGNSSARIIERFAKKHTAAMRRDRSHLLTLRQRGQTAAILERDVFTELNRFVEQHESWEMGLLTRFLGDVEQEAFDKLVLYRDEFSTVRDLYQQGFELACKCLWVLVAAQNTVKRGNPEDFGTDHPDIVPANKRPRNLAKYDKLANAYKIAYVVQVPGWEVLGELLNNQHRNTIGHATAHHDLQTGRVTSDLDALGMTYLEFLGQTLGVFEALSTLAQVLRAARVASSRDFKLE